MPAFMKLAGVEGEATDSGHKGWVIIESMSSPIYRSIAEGAKDQQRTKGETTLGDVVVVRQMDKSSVQLQQNCASGKFFQEVEVHFCSTVNDKQEPYLKYKLKDVIITSFSFHGNASGSPLPSEQITLGYTSVDWTYITLDPKTGKPQGNVPGSYNPGAGKS